jgi:hypothetical protein
LPGRIFFWRRPKSGTVVKEIQGYSLFILFNLTLTGLKRPVRVVSGLILLHDNDFPLRLIFSSDFVERSGKLITERFRFWLHTIRCQSLLYGTDYRSADIF